MKSKTTWNHPGTSWNHLKPPMKYWGHPKTAILQIFYYFLVLFVLRITPSMLLVKKIEYSLHWINLNAVLHYITLIMILTFIFSKMLPFVCFRETWSQNLMFSTLNEIAQGYIAICQLPFRHLFFQFFSQFKLFGAYFVS